MRKNKERIIESIKELIINIEIPPGQPLSESWVSQKFKISRTLVREILRKVEAEGFVEIYPNRGAFVAGMTVSDIDEIFQIRESLEGIAARSAAEKMPHEEVEKIHARLKDLSIRKDTRYEEARLVGDTLHSSIIDATNNKRLKHLMKSLNCHFLRMRNFLSDNPEVMMKDDIPQHLEIIEGIRARDPDLAEKAMRNHIRSTKAKMFMRLAKTR